tara:strand:- start:177 stop:1019 length:843 start_codon:yes stop_codon:yes gene_type:complete
MTIFNGYTSRAQVIRALRAKGFTFSTALGATESNPKLVKGEKLGVLSKPHNLAPGRESGKWNLCASASPGCLIACLNTAGNPVYLRAKLSARIQRTHAFMTMRKAYIALIAFELEALESKALKLGMVPAWRPNTTSDYPFQSVPLTVNGKPHNSLIHYFSGIEAYDYTKISKKALQWAKGLLPSNYHITFSKSEINDSCVDKVLRAGGNVAVVFEKVLPGYYKGVTVINGDESDVRFMDSKGVIVGLKAKGLGKVDSSGFVVRERAYKGSAARIVLEAVS